MNPSSGFFSTVGARLDAGLAGLRGRSLSTFARAFLRGDDAVEGQAAQLTRPYAQSSWVRSAVNHVIGEIGARCVKFYAGDEEFEDAAFSAWWAAPAYGPATAFGPRPRLSHAQVLEDLAIWAKLEGEFFLLFDDTWAAAGVRRNYRTLSPFIIANPQRMRAIVRSGELEAWEYIDVGGRRFIYLPEQVVHWRGSNPYDDFRGVGDLQAAMVAAESAFYTGAYIRGLMRNNNDEGTIVVSKNGPINDAQREQIVADLRAKRAARRAGIARDIFLEGGQGDITVERPQEAAAGAELVSNLTVSREEIFLAFGVPPSMGQVKASYSIGKDSDYYQLITRTCIPLGAKIAGAFSTVASRMTGLVLEAEMEWDEHPVMQEVRSSRVDTAIKLWNAGMCWEKINDYLDLGLQPFPGWDQAYLPFSVAPVDTSGSAAQSVDPALDPALADAESRRKTVLIPEVAALQLALAARVRAAQPAPAAVVETETLKGLTCGCDLDPEGLCAQKADRPPAAIAQWRSHMQARREQAKAFESRFGRWLQTVRAEVLRKLDGQAAKTVVSQQKAAASDLLFDLTKATGEFISAMKRQHTLALDAAGKQVYRELGRDDPFKFAQAEVLDFVSQRENRLRGVPQDVFTRLQRTLQEGLDAGESTTQLATRVRSECNAIDKGRAQVIAQTEVSAAYGYGRNAAMKSAGIRYKAWLTSGNSNVREAHLVAGQTYSPDTPIPMDEPFIVGGEELMYPGDASGRPENTINCHCIQIAVADPKEETL